MSVNKIGSDLTPYLKGSSIFEGHPKANLATVGKVGLVHSGNLQIGVYTTIYDACADGIKVGQLYGIGKKHPTGLLESSGSGGGGMEDPGMEEPKEAPKAEDPPFVVAEDCELVVYEIRIFTGFELRLCEQKDLILSFEGHIADAILKQDTLNARIAELKARGEELAKQESDLVDELDNLTKELEELETKYQELTLSCAKEAAEGPAGSSESCQELADFIKQGDLDRIAILKARISDITPILMGVKAEKESVDAEVKLSEKQKDQGKQTISLLSQRAETSQKALDDAEQAYASIGGSIAPNIGAMNSLAVGLTNIASSCVEAECCPIPDGPAGEEVIQQLQVLAKLMADSGAEPKA